MFQPSKPSQVTQPRPTADGEEGPGLAPFGDTQVLMSPGQGNLTSQTLFLLQTGWEGLGLLPLATSVAETRCDPELLAAEW